MQTRRLGSGDRELLAALGFGSSPLRAQETGTPEEFVVTYMAATRSADWARVASLMHPDALADFKNMFGVIAEMDTAGEVLPNLFGVPDAAAYAESTPEHIFAGFMKTIVNSSPEMATMLSGSTVQFIGHVREPGRGLTHAVYRMNMGAEGLNISTVDVVPLKRYPGEWRAMLTGDIEGMAAGLKQQIGGSHE